MKQRILTVGGMTAKAAVAAAFACSLALGSCIRDRIDENGGGAEDYDGVTTLSFAPHTETHGGDTRATYDDTYTSFAEYFGGASQVQDLFEDVTGGGARAGYGREADRKINSFRILIYNPTPTEDGELVQKGDKYMNFFYSWNDGDPLPEMKINIDPGKYHFVFIANEGQQDFPGYHDAGNVEATLGAEFTQTYLNAYLRRIEKAGMFYSDKYTGFTVNNPAIGIDKNIPMSACLKNVVVSGKNKVEYTDESGTTQTFPKTGKSTWDVKMTRNATRFSFGITLPKEEYEAWKAYHTATGSTPALYLSNMSIGTLMVIGANSGGSNYGGLPVQEIPVSNVKSGAGTTIGKLMERADGSAFIFVDRLIYGESYTDERYGSFNHDEQAKSRAVRASLYFSYGGRMEQREILVHAPNPETSDTGYDIPRNHWVWATADMGNPELETIIRVLPWGDAKLEPTGLTQYNLNTDRSAFIFRGSGAGASLSDRMDVFTDHPEGWHIGGLPHWITVSQQTGNPGTSTVTVSVEENTSGQIRSGVIEIIAGGIYKEIAVTQLPTEMSITETGVTGVNMYAGAFWRANQWGERLIRITRPTISTQNAIDGAWTAYVVEGEDWISLDTKQPLDPGIWNPNGDPLSADDPGFDELNSVTRYQTTVSGEMRSTAPDNQIYFRIGLNGPYTPTADKPARYGMVLLVYTKSGITAYQRIWVRQGEGADYLMRPEGETASGSGMTTRPHAVKWSPYNLTAPEYRDQTIAREAQAPKLGPGDGVFVKWPTQAGALFQFAPDYGADGITDIYPFNPRVETYNPAYQDSNIDGDMYDTKKIGNWAKLAGRYETCPTVDGVAYRRPSASNSYIRTSTIDIDNSEIAQSLFINPNSLMQSPLNVTKGMYADGYYDRRYLSIRNDIPLVNKDGHDAAFMGTLFFNPATYHSLFFPNAGGLTDHPTSPRGVYGVGSYWSSSIKDANCWRFSMAKDQTGTNSFEINGPGVAQPIRCVDAPVEPMPNYVLTVPGMVGIRHSDLGKDPKNFTLTLKGSGTYLEDPKFKNLPFVRDHREDYEDEPVYAVYFKWGTMVAILGGPDGDAFDASDVVWYPTRETVGVNYTLPTGGFTSWSSFSFATPTSGTTGYRIPSILQTITSGSAGDICRLVDGGRYGNTAQWQTPTGKPWTTSKLIYGTYTPFGPQYGDYANEDSAVAGDTYIGWAAQRGRGTVMNWNATLKGAISDDQTFFLPVTGARFSNATNSDRTLNGGTGDMRYSTALGVYWTSSVTTNNLSAMSGYAAYYDNLGFCVRFSAASVSPSKDLYRSYAIPVRCVPEMNE